MIHPLHPHHLEQVDPMNIYPTSNGHWKCDNCHREGGPLFGRPYHCSICSYDLCQTCITSERTLAHKHLLFYVNTRQHFYQQSGGMWKCDACQGTCTDLGQSCSYHCEICSFDLCQGCYEQRHHPVHCHPIRKADTWLVYPRSGGNWVCDVCCNTSRPYERFVYHCAECDFNVCDNCFNDHHTPLHTHPVVKVDSHVIYRQFNGGWKCDNCGSIHETSKDRWPWHCRRCEYDICDRCIYLNPFGVVDVGVADPGGRPSFSGTCPGERKGVKKKEDAKENTDDEDQCIICMDLPKNATLIHGDTEHSCCCWECAQKVKQRGDPCPICRAHIDHVIRQFNS